MKAKITIPSKLSELNLKQYQEFIKIENPTEVDVLKEFCYLSENVIKAMPKKQVKSIAYSIVKLLEEKPPLIKHFKHKGVKYGFIPNLDEMSYGENLDVNTFLEEEQKLHLAMEVLYRPISYEKGKDYLIQKYDGVLEGKLAFMPLDAALGAVVFFYDLAKDLLNCIPDSIKSQLTQQELQMPVSLENGVGTTNSLQSVEKHLKDLKRLVRITSMSA